MNSVDVGQILVSVLTNNGVWTAIVSSIAIIALGFILGKVKFLPENFDKALIKFVMMITLPCLTFVSFLMTVSFETFSKSAFSLAYGFIIYTLMVLLSKVMFLWIKDKNKRIVFEIIFVFGSTNFFGQPLINAIDPEAFGLSNIYNVANLLYVFSYAYYMICVKKDDDVTASIDLKNDNNANKTENKLGLKFVLKKVFLNPIVIATFVGFFFWIMQLTGWGVVKVGEQSVSFWMINVTCVPVYNTLKTVGGLTSPLIWLSIGMILGKTSLKDAAKDKYTWIYSILKVIVAPTLNFLLLLLFRQIPGLGNLISFKLVFASTIMWATPTASAIVSYCVSSNKEPVFVSSSYLVSTIVAVIFSPFLIVFLKVIEGAGIFA